MFNELAERSLISPLTGTKYTYVGLAIVTFSISFEIAANKIYIHDM